MINYQVIIVIALQLSCDPQQQQTATSHLTLWQNYEICQTTSFALPIITERGTSIFFYFLMELLREALHFFLKYFLKS